MIDTDPGSEGRREPVRRAIRRYWDAHPISTDSVAFEAGTPASFDAIYARWEAQMSPRRLAFLESCAGRRLLEIGCGIAVDGRYLASHGADYQAVDLSRESLKLARRHFELHGLPARFANADATRLPFADERFDIVYSIGVLHHVPDMAAACREVVRLVRPGGRVRVMLYHRDSYHYALVRWGIRPLLWLLLKLPFGDALARLGPWKLRQMLDVCRERGLDTGLVLSISTDWSAPGEGNFNPLSHFVGREDVAALLAGLEGFEFYTTDLKYWPLPGARLRRFVEARWGFFLQVSARKPERPAGPAS